MITKNLLTKLFLEALTIDTEIKAKRDNMISELITFRITKAQAKENSSGGCQIKFTLKWLSCKYIERN